MYHCLERKNPSHPGSPKARSMIICSGTGHLHFSVAESQVSFSLCVLLMNLQSRLWLTGEMALKITCEMPFCSNYLYSYLSFVQETGPEKKIELEAPSYIHTIRTLGLRKKSLLYHDKLRCLIFPATKHIPYWINRSKGFSVQLVIHKHRHPDLYLSLLFSLICKSIIASFK